MTTGKISPAVGEVRHPLPSSFFSLPERELMDRSKTASEADASFFDQLRRGQRKAAEPTKRATPARGLQTPHLMQFFSAASWSGFDDSATVRSSLSQSASLIDDEQKGG
jgi:hypothetical protein